VQFPPGIAPPAAATPGQSPNPGQSPTPFPANPGYQQTPGAGAAGAFGPSFGQPPTPPPGAAGRPNQAANLIQQILTTPRQPPSSISAFTSGNTGGIAGVASTAEGKGIHVINDHSKYKEWEFVYDLKKDKTVVGAGAVNQQQQIQQQMQQNQNGILGGNSFGSSPNSGPFNSTSPNGNSPAAPATPTTAPPSQ
jgi:hypothetical protein